MGKRKKTVYVQYDYEEAYKEHLEQMDEYFVQQLLQGKDKKKKTVYATKEIRAGEQLEVEIYPEFTRSELKEIPTEAMRKKQRQAQWNLNEKNSRKQCERVINENFGNRDIWATFVYADENLPKTMDEAQKNMQNYIRRLNGKRKKAGLQNARYVYVTECSADGRWHHHIVLDGDMDMDTVENTWKLGNRNQVRRLDKDEDGLTGMAKYITKEKKKKSQKKWAASKGLKKPKVHVNHYKFRKKDVNEIVKNNNVMKEKLLNWYEKEGYTFTSAEVRYNDFNGRYYIYARMRKERSSTRCRGAERRKEQWK